MVTGIVNFSSFFFFTFFRIVKRPLFCIKSFAKVIFHQWKGIRINEFITEFFTSNGAVGHCQAIILKGKVGGEKEGSLFNVNVTSLFKLNWMFPVSLNSIAIVCCSRNGKIWPSIMQASHYCCAHKFAFLVLQSGKIVSTVFDQ